MISPGAPTLEIVGLRVIPADRPLVALPSGAHAQTPAWAAQTARRASSVIAVADGRADPPGLQAPRLTPRRRLADNRPMLARRLAPVLAVLAACGPDGRADSTTSATATTTATASATAVDDSGDLPTTDPTGGATTTTSTTSTSTSTTSTTTASTGDASTGATEGVGSTTLGPEPKMDFPAEMPIPVKDIPGLVSITFYETTGQVMEYTFLVDGPELNTLLPDPLSLDSRDIQGTSVEFYDVYYSDVDGNFDPNGSYLTIAGSFGAKLPAGGGLNLAEISLNYDNDVVEYGSFLASFVGLGDNYVPGSEVNAIDGNLATHTTMGNTVDTPDQRLRVTLGFKSSLMPG